ncbi:hypothetical protein LCGC14_1150180 [marine sediment metagenome]|uniref:Uncharacterized protein n=1 Tax=marine sediment metagenome TaxID=412755 RepID=A0A0F9PDW5_9ZZZZ
MYTYDEEHVVIEIFVKWDVALQEYFRWELHPDDCPACKLGLPV